MIHINLGLFIQVAVAEAPLIPFPTIHPNFRVISLRSTNFKSNPFKMLSYFFYINFFTKKLINLNYVTPFPDEVDHCKLDLTPRIL